MEENKYNVSDEEMEELARTLRELLDEEEPDFYGELKTAAWNVLHENPGIDMDEWIDIVMRQYPTEVVDAIGSHPAEAYASLCEMWQDEYTDPESGEWNTLQGWSEFYATDVECLQECIEKLEKELSEARREIRRFKAEKFPKQ